MANHFKNLSAGLLATIALMGCNLGVEREEDAAPTQGYYFEGYIYDGVTNERLSDYEISASQRGETISGSVSGDGHFMFGPIQPDHDYVVTIEAEDYREFFAAQSQMGSLPNSDDNQATFYYEAFLFPTSIVSPEVTLDFYTPDGAGSRPDGTLRLTPTGGGVLSGVHLDASTTTPSVGGQIWTNDADGRQRTVTFPVEDGEVVVEEGDLIYGVAYTGTIYGSDGYAYESFTYTSGLEGDRTISLERLDPQNLAITHNSLEISNRNEDAEIVITFNYPIELASSLPGGQLREIIDDAFTITSPNLDNDGNTNVLVSNIGDEPDERERGTSLDIDGNTLTLSWARDNSNFDTRDGDDPIESVTYGALDQINLRIEDGRTDQEVNLATLLGTSSLTVYVDGASATNPLPDLALESTSTSGSQSGGVVTVEYEFNRPIELATTSYSAVQMAEFVDDSFSINSPNAQVNPDVGWDMMNTLPADSLATVQERGTSISVSGSTLTLTWNGSLATADALDPILEVTFPNLTLVQIRPVGTTGAEDTSLGAFVGVSQPVTLSP